MVIMLLNPPGRRGQGNLGSELAPRPPNPAGAVDAPMTRLFAFESRRRRATDQQR